MNSLSISIGIIGASGYGGAELLRLLEVHPHFSPTCLVAASHAGVEVGGLYPHLSRCAGMRYLPMEDARTGLEACDLVFCALPHGEAMVILPEMKNKVIIDLGGDFRLREASAYEEWYGFKHTCPERLREWVYGLPELFAAQIKSARRIANPGCYATAAVLAIAPLCRSDLAAGVIVIDALSGVSGAGRAPKPETHFAHVYDDIRAYKVGRHQHTPEIEMALELDCGKPVRVSFTPHLVPAVRGIHITCSAELTHPIGEEKLLELYRDFYREAPFVKVSREQHGTKETRGSNYVFITPSWDQRCGRAIVTCVLDNLVKGAAGQALQNANLCFGFAQECGLQVHALYP